MYKASDIMTRNVHSVTENTDVGELAKLFIETGVSAMPVLGEGGHLVGVVTETDLVEQDKPLHIPSVISIFDWVIYLESEKNFKEELDRVTARKVGEICERDVTTCTPDTPVSEIATLMVDKKAHLIPVVEEGKLVGVVARLDVIRSMGI